MLLPSFKSPEGDQGKKALKKKGNLKKEKTLKKKVHQRRGGRQGSVSRLDTRLLVIEGRKGLEGKKG